MDADHPQLLAQAQLPLRTTIHQVPLQDPTYPVLDPFRGWVGPEGQSFPYALPSDIQDASAAGSNPYADSAAAMAATAARTREEQTSRPLPADTTHRFPSTHPPPAAHPQRRTPPNPQAHMAAHAGTLASGLTLDPTMTMVARVNANGSAEMLAAAQQAGPYPAAATSTAPSLVPNLDGSLSWSSATTHLQMQDQLDHLYRYQPHTAAAALRQQAPSRGPPHRPDSSLQQRSSRSSIGPAQAPLRAPSHPRLSPQQMAAHQYSLDLHRHTQGQLQEKLRQQQQRDGMAAAAAAAAAQERRNSEEEAYYRRLAEAYGPQPLSGSPHQVAGMGTYFPQGDQDGPHARPPSHPHPSHHPAHMLGMHPPPHPLQAHLAHPQAMAGVEAYPPHLLVDGAGRDPLELGVLEATPAGMIKYESPLLE